MWAISKREVERRGGGVFPFSLSTNLVVRLAGTAMAFTFAAFCYMLTLVLCAALIFFVIWQVSGPVHTGTALRLKWAHAGRPRSVPRRQTSTPSYTQLYNTERNTHVYTHTLLRYSSGNDMLEECNCTCV